MSSKIQESLIVACVACDTKQFVYEYHNAEYHRIEVSCKKCGCYILCGMEERSNSPNGKPAHIHIWNMKQIELKNERTNAMNERDKNRACGYMDDLATEIHQHAVDKGFWKDKEGRNKGMMIALMHSELSGALEALRHDNSPSEHIPEFTGVEEEMADVVIRVMDFCHGFGYNLTGAIREKMKFNAGREHMHGKKF